MHLSDKILAFRGKAPSLPLPPLQDLQNTKLTNLRALNVSPDKEQHIWGMRSNLVLPALAVTLLVGLVMLGASALMQPEDGTVFFCNEQAAPFAVNQTYGHHVDTPLLLPCLANTFDDFRQMSAAQQLGLLSSEHLETLVLYTYSNSDTEYERNLHYFVEHGMADGDGCDYVIIVQEGKGILPSQLPLPDLPSNAQYIFHENICFDWGTFGWALKSTALDVGSYKFIVFMNSSIRGPHLPAYWPAFVHWTSILTSRLIGKVKLVGSTISCEGTFLNGDLTAARRQNPHVQSYVMATDQEGLKVLQEDGLVFKCYETLHDTVWNSELGSSVAIFNAGYTIDSLLLKYQGVDWRDKDNWNCNAGLNPYAVDAYDGVNLNPLEVVFIKVKSFLLQADWPAPKMSQTYDRWSTFKGAPITAQSNAYADHMGVYRTSRISVMTARGSSCFNFELYRSKNSLPFEDGTSLWDHFVQHGQFEGRTFEFKCWQDGSRSSPVDGQWYPRNATGTSLTTSNPKARLSVHLKMPRTKLQWKLQQQLQQQLDQHPELADAAVDVQAKSRARHILQYQGSQLDMDRSQWISPFGDSHGDLYKDHADRAHG